MFLKERGEKSKRKIMFMEIKQMDKTLSVLHCVFHVFRIQILILPKSSHILQKAI